MLVKVTMKELKERKKESFQIFDEIATTYDPLNRVLSMGIDKGWRKKMKAALPNRDQLELLDLACGTADVPLSMISDQRVKTIQGMDLSEKMLEIGREKIKEKKLNDRITLSTGDGMAIPRPDQSHDAITISFGIRNFSDPLVSMKDCYRVLKKDGKLLILEFSLPENFFFRAIYLFYFRTILPLIGNLFSGHGDAYTYLNQTVEDFPYGKDFAQLMESAGFKNIKYTPLTFGIATLYEGEK